MRIFFSKKINRRLTHSLNHSLHKKIKYNYLIIIILAFLFIIFVFSVMNLQMVFQLRREWKNIQANLAISQPPLMRYFEEQIRQITSPALSDIQIVHSAVNANFFEGIENSVIDDANNINQAEPTSLNKNDSDPLAIKEAIIANETLDIADARLEGVVGVTENNISAPNENPAPSRHGWKYNVFGDGFSNSYYVDMNKTNFYYDETGTAFSFRPVYEKKDNGMCAQEYCGFSEKEELGVDPSQINKPQCLSGDNSTCLVFDGENLKYKGSEVKEFSTLFSKNKPAQVAIYSLNATWLVGAVWTEGGQEMGRAWRFDGQRMIELDPQRRIPFITRSGYGGSRISFSGDDNNYLVVYAGYDLSGYQVVNNTVWSLADFFNVRLAEGGFIPKIIKQRQGQETVWYICSLTPGKPKLIKMWQNNSQVIRGLISLTEDVFKNNYETALCREGAAGSLEIVTAQKIKKEIKYQRWSFIDKGFDQAQDYEIRSVNLSSLSGQIKMVNFNGLSLCGRSTCLYSELTDDLKFTISNNANDWQKIIMGQEYLFTTSGVSLFWRLQAKADTSRNYYSPWFGAVNSAYYAWQE